jgi:hypothetical protein
LDLPIWLATGLSVAAPSAPAPAPTPESASPGFTTVCVNTRLQALTFADGWQFNSFAVLGDVILAATGDGLFVLGGDTDNGAAINAGFSTGLHDGDSAQQKRTTGLLVGYRTNGDLRLAVVADEHEDEHYILESDGHATLHNARVKIGRGMKGRHWQLVIDNIEGDDFEVSTMTLDQQTLGRRLG